MDLEYPFNSDAGTSYFHRRRVSTEDEFALSPADTAFHTHTQTQAMMFGTPPGRVPERVQTTRIAATVGDITMQRKKNEIKRKDSQGLRLVYISVRKQSIKFHSHELHKSARVLYRKYSCSP